MKPVDPRSLQKFVQLVSDELQGDWAICSSVILPLINAATQVFSDIDIALPAAAEPQELLRLMGIAERLGWPVETVHFHASHYAQSVPEWRRQLLPLRKTRTCAVYRPDVNLFIGMHVRRLTETDLTDCLDYLSYALREGEEIREDYLSQLIRRHLAKADSGSGRSERLEALLRVVES